MTHFDDARTAIGQAEQDFAAVSQARDDALTSLTKAGADLSQAAADLSAAKTELTVSAATIADLRAQLATANATIADLRKQLPPPPTPVPAKMLVGSCNSDVNTTPAKTDAQFGFMKVYRLFSSGTTPPAVDTSRLWCISWKMSLDEILAGTHDAAITAWAKSLPAGAKVDYTIYHEPENDPWTPEQFKAAYRRVVTMVRAAKPVATVRFVLIYMDWTLNAQSVYKTGPKAGQKGRNPEDWWPGDDVVDIVGWDLDGAAPSNGVYPDHAQYLPKIQAFSALHKKPWCVPEFGAPRDAADVDGSKRVAWMKTTIAAVQAAGCEYLCFYNWPSTAGNPLTTAAEVAYVQALVKASA